MAIHVKLTKSKKQSAKVEQPFSSDRSAALARLAVPTPAGGGPNILPSSSRPPGFAKLARAAASFPRPTEAAPAVGAREAATMEPALPEAGVSMVPENLAGGVGEAPALQEAGGGAALAMPPGTALLLDDSLGDRNEGVSEALLESSNAPGKARALALIFRWGFTAGVLLGVGFLAIRFLVPLLQELRHPGGTDAIHDKDASTAVKALQQTRAVVAKNNANVNSLDEVVAASEGKTLVKPPAAKPPPAPPVVRREVRSVTAGQTDLAPFYEAVARLTVSGVFDGPEPRVYLNGRIVKYGEIIDRDLALRFVGVDTESKAVLFTNAANVTFRKYY